MQRKKEPFVLKKSMRESDGSQLGRNGAGNGAGSSRVHSRGQGMTEYIVIVALVALGAITAYGYLGQAIGKQTGGMAKEIAGTDSAGAKGEANQAADAAVNAATKKSLATYGDTAKGGAGAAAPAP